MHKVFYRTQHVRDLDIFYRESGPADGPVLLLLHGYPTSSFMFRNLIPLLAHAYHLIAPDLPGFGFSDKPPADQFQYTFDHLADVMQAFIDSLEIKRFTIYIFDYGTLYQYQQGASDISLIAPETYTLDQHFLDEPGNTDIQLDLLRDYRNNVALYPKFQEYFREEKPPLLAVWGNRDPFFLPTGADGYLRDNPNARVKFYETGHFALETHIGEIAADILQFLSRHMV